MHSVYRKSLVRFAISICMNVYTYIENVKFSAFGNVNKEIRKWQCLCIFTGFSIILSLIGTMCAKGMRTSQPQCQVDVKEKRIQVYKVRNMKHTQ